MLTITIPTFNRRIKLDYLLNSIITCPSYIKNIDFFKILVVDNCTPQGNEVLYKYSHHIDYVINSYNIGGNSNILRCVELAKTEWVWVLGDDDNIEDNTFDIILSYTEKYRDVALINFNGEYNHIKRIENQLIYSEYDLISKVDYSNLLFISNNILKPDLFMKYAEKLYQNIGNSFHYLNAVPNILCELNYPILLSPEIIVRPNLNVVESESWSRELFYSVGLNYADSLMLHKNRHLMLATLERRSTEFKIFGFFQLFQLIKRKRIKSLELELNKIVIQMKIRKYFRVRLFMNYFVIKVGLRVIYKFDY